MRLDPYVRRLIRALEAGAHAPVSGVAERRAAFRGLMGFSETGARVAGIENHVLPGPAGALPIRIYTPLSDAGGPLPGLVFFHGGGMVAGDLDTYDPLCRALCQETGCRLIAVDYRLAPEYPYPAAFDDAVAATLWLFTHAAELRLDPQRIGIAGDSAGGTLAAVVCHHLARAKTAVPCFQLLMCPVLDWSEEALTRRDFGDGHLVSQAMMREDLACFLPGNAAAGGMHVSPLWANDFAGQPPAFIHTAEFDPLRDEGEAYAAKLRAAGVEVNYTCHPGMVHLFYGLGRVVPYAAEMLRRIGITIRATLGAEAAHASAV
jgi:acetyl esterase